MPSPSHPLMPTSAKTPTIPQHPVVPQPGAQVELLADKNGGFVRMLGFELGVGEGTGPKCQRFAGIVDNGILLKVVSGWVGGKGPSRCECGGCLNLCPPSFSAAGCCWWLAAIHFGVHAEGSRAAPGAVMHAQPPCSARVLACGLSSSSHSVLLIPARHAWLDGFACSRLPPCLPSHPHLPALTPTHAAQRIESKPIELKTTDCKSMLELWDDVYMK